jgi:2-C-methyl-D-erythritol 4-phosphate cytidylyltransferase
VTSPSEGKDFAAVVTAAGASGRMGGSRKKEYRLLNGRPVLALAVGPFVDSGIFTRIVVTVPRGHLDNARELLGPYASKNGVSFIEGGETRQDSVMKALVSLESDPPWGVLVHDGARPWISGGLIARVIESVMRHRACVPIVEVPEAVKQAGGEGFVIRHLRRQTVFLAQTPQGFEYAGLLSAYRAAVNRGVVCADDAELYDMFEGPVATVPGEIENRKITYERDLPAE